MPFFICDCGSRCSDWVGVVQNIMRQGRALDATCCHRLCGPVCAFRSHPNPPVIRPAVPSFPRAGSLVATTGILPTHIWLREPSSGASFCADTGAVSDALACPRRRDADVRGFVPNTLVYLTVVSCAQSFRSSPREAVEALAVALLAARHPQTLHWEGAEIDAPCRLWIPLRPGGSINVAGRQTQHQTATFERILRYIDNSCLVVKLQ